MDFQSYINENKVIKGEKDFQKSKALIKISENNLKYLATLPVNDSLASTILVSCYEALRQTLEAMCLLEGYKVYSHEAYTSYLRELNEISISEKFDRLRKLRNGVNYYGKSVSRIVAKNAKIDVILVRSLLIEKYLKELL